MKEQKDSFTVPGMIQELDAGVFEQKLDYALRAIAKAVRNHDSNKVSGEMTLKLTLKRVAEGNQIMVDHKIATKTPTARGKKTEEDTTQTVMHSNEHGGLSIMPDTQIGLFDRSKTETE